MVKLVMLKFLLL